MTIQVTGKNIDAGEAYGTYVTEKVTAALAKYVGSDVTGHIRLERERSQFRTSCSIRLRSGLLVEAQGEAGDAYASADAAVEHLEKRVRRHKRRLKNHHNGRGAEGPMEHMARDATVQVSDSDGEEAPGGDDNNPVVIAETERRIRELPVSQAVMELDLTDGAFLVFRNAGHGGLNIVYRRHDGNIGWIDPKA